MNLKISEETLNAAKQYSAEWVKNMDAINKRIEEAEEFLQNHNLHTTVSLGRDLIYWDSDKNRICLDGKPLREHKVHRRIAHHQSIENLIATVVDTHASKK